MIDRHQAITLRAQLAARGLTALQFTDGVTEWAAAGLPIKRSASHIFPLLAPTP